MNNSILVVVYPEILKVQMSSFQCHRMNSTSALRTLFYAFSFMHQCKYILRKHKTKECFVVSVLIMDVGLRHEH